MYLLRVILSSSRIANRRGALSSFIVVECMRMKYAYIILIYITSVFKYACIYIYTYIYCIYICFFNDMEVGLNWKPNRGLLVL